MIWKDFCTQISKKLIITFLAFLSLKIKVRYDDAFKSKFGGDVNNAARRIMAYAQSYWKLSASLGTTINFVIDANIQQITGKYVAATDL